MALDSNLQKMMTDLKKRKRGIIKAALTRTRNFVNNFDPTVDVISLLEFRQEELSRISHKFDDVQAEIELLCPDNIEDSERERDDFEKNYFSIRSQIQEIINLEKHHNSSGLDASATTINATTTPPRARLAPIDLPKFSENIQEWETFFDCFKVMVHQEDYYSPAQKFYYLRSVLSGQALDLIKSLPITGANYALALKKLEARYDNRDLVIQAHIREILHCPPIESSSAQELLNLHSHISTHIAALEALKLPIGHWDAWLVTIIIERLDNATSQEWQLRRTNTELSKYTELMEFLSNRSIALEGADALAINTVQFNDVKSVKAIKRKGYSAGDFSKGAFLVASDVKEACACCSGTHKLYTCTKFKDVAIANRINLVRKAKLCFNCLHLSHQVNKCNSRFSCQGCKGRHNTLLHVEISTVPISPVIENKPVTANEDAAPTNTEKIAMVVKNSDYVFLATAVVTVSDKFGLLHTCPAVLDSGSQINFVSRRFASLLHLEAKTDTVPISGIGGSKSQSSASVELYVRSLVNNFAVNLTCYILPIIVTELSSVPAPRNGWEIPDESPYLADPIFFEARPIDLLIGSGIFFDLLVGLGFCSKINP